MTLDPEALRENARRTREMALQALDAADEDDIRADAMEQLLAAEVEVVLAQGKLDAAQDSTDEHDTAAFELVDATADTWPTRDAIYEPLNLTNFIDCPAWIARIERPEVYRRILISRAEGNAVADQVHDAAVAAARKAWRYDAALIGDVENTGGM